LVIKGTEGEFPPDAAPKLETCSLINASALQSSPSQSAWPRASSCAR